MARVPSRLGTATIQVTISRSATLPVGQALEEVAAGKLRKVKQDASTVYEDEI